jgi:hypothetical protein
MYLRDFCGTPSRFVQLRPARSRILQRTPASATNTINLLHLAEFPSSPLP